MLDGSWEAVRKLCEIGKHMSCDADLRTIFRANEWLAIKRLGQFEDVRADVENWDTSALELRFKFVQAALLDELDTAFAMAEQLLERGEITTNALFEWPVLSELREDERFEALAPSASTTNPSGNGGPSTPSGKAQVDEASAQES
jgi:hypothetical protein